MIFCQHRRRHFLLLAAVTILSTSLSSAATINVNVGNSGNAESTITYSSDRFRLLLINGGSAFFEPVAQGFLKRCLDYHEDVQFEYAGVVYESITPIIESHLSHYHPVTQDSCEEKAAILRDALQRRSIDGIIMNPFCNDTFTTTLVQEAHEAQVPVVFIDGDVPEAPRSAYIGTNQFFLGQTMARLLRQLRPEGGTFCFMGRRSNDRLQGFLQEITKFNHRPDRAHWTEVGRHFAAHVQHNSSRYRWNYEFQHKVQELRPTAVVAMIQSPMRQPNWTWFIDHNRQHNITTIGVDGADYQLDYLHQRYVDGLVGQLPYEWGFQAVDVLRDILLRQQKGEVIEADIIITTNVVAYNLIPVTLPPLELEQNLLGPLRYIGISCFVVVTLAALGCMGWTVYYWKTPLLRMSQPWFLLAIALGVMILASTLSPLSFDDEGLIDPQQNNVPQEEEDSDDADVMQEQQDPSPIHTVAVCMSIPWLAFGGFTLTFSALFRCVEVDFVFPMCIAQMISSNRHSSSNPSIHPYRNSKTWRINRLLNPRKSHEQVKVTYVDVLAPFAVLFLCNVIALVCWTVLDPLTYTRQFHSGTDFWNREFESYGACRSNNPLAFLTPLLAFNFLVVAITCWQAFQARDISPQFSEARAIGMSLASMLQTFLTGIPVLAVVREMPVPFYLVMTFVIFALSMILLGFIFVPKMRMQSRFSLMSETEQSRSIAMSIRQMSRRNVRAGSESRSFPKSNSSDFMVLAKSGFFENNNNHRGGRGVASSSSLRKDVSGDFLPPFEEVVPTKGQEDGSSGAFQQKQPLQDATIQRDVAQASEDP
ncbi:Gamma-aminobutyric acid (GABA) B receptor [Seminavis robusta]|uniref:Gamma-aminobutyric acid (GABA) B receptor n=1 Tax=Seminavis robusta TaxID=568900 RepID=A0A9N8DSI3_9STRA|nr:Gamma-aminobutyric acid (GABA) B receptor [Seminavis robusta]|eukprot:Sro248_g098320.1 Gamma-aminobutyric acid (GABA) B receptor (819) ;mRNA; r:29155-31611